MLCLSGVLGRQDGLGGGVDDVGCGESQSLRKCEVVGVDGGGQSLSGEFGDFLSVNSVAGNKDKLVKAGREAFVHDLQQSIVGSIVPGAAKEADVRPCCMDVGDAAFVDSDDDVVVVGGGNPVVECSSTPTWLGCGGNGSSVEIFCVNKDDAALHVKPLLCLFVVCKSHSNPSTHPCQRKPINTSPLLAKSLLIGIKKPFNTDRKADEMNLSTHDLSQHHAHISPRSPDISSSRISEN